MKLSNKFYNGCWLAKRKISRYYYNIRNRMRLNATHVNYSKEIEMNGKIIISNCGEISIGKNVIINSGNYPNPVGTSLTRIYTQNSNSKINIGNNVGMSSTLLFADNEIRIDDDVLIGAETMIFDTDFHGLLYIGNSKRNNVEDGKPVHIKQGAFIGTKTVILKGVEVGEGAVIGAGSVVTKDIPVYEIWAGNPAAFIRKVNMEKMDE